MHTLNDSERKDGNCQLVTFKNRVFSNGHPFLTSSVWTSPQKNLRNMCTPLAHNRGPRNNGTSTCSEQDQSFGTIANNPGRFAKLAQDLPVWIFEDQNQKKRKRCCGSEVVFECLVSTVHMSMCKTNVSINW